MHNKLYLNRKYGEKHGVFLLCRCNFQMMSFLLLLIEWQKEFRIMLQEIQLSENFRKIPAF